MRICAVADLQNLSEGWSPTGKCIGPPETRHTVIVWLDIAADGDLLRLIP